MDAAGQKHDPLTAIKVYAIILTSLVLEFTQPFWYLIFFLFKFHLSCFYFKYPCLSLYHSLPFESALKILFKVFDYWLTHKFIVHSVVYLLGLDRPLARGCGSHTHTKLVKGPSTYELQNSFYLPSKYYM